MIALSALLVRLRRDQSGLAAVEYALSAPIILSIFLSGAELTNFTIAKMRVSQLALHVADNGSRIGTDSLLTNPQITEAQINDLLAGANLQAGGLDLRNHGRIIVSSFEPVANPNTNSRFRIRWQRCFGAKVYPSSYGRQGDTNLTGMGPTGRQVTAPDNSGVIYVEIAYDYQPLISSRLAPRGILHDVAAMVVRDERDFGGNNGVGIYNPDNVTASTCPAS